MSTEHRIPVLGRGYWLQALPDMAGDKYGLRSARVLLTASLLWSTVLLVLVATGTAAHAQGRDSVPANPQRIRVVAGNGQATLRWSDPADPTITGYQVRQREIGERAWKAWVDIDDSNAQMTRYTAKNLRQGRTYQFRIRAVNGAGAGKASQVTVTLSASAPTLTPTATLASADPKGIVPSAPVNVQVVVHHEEKEQDMYLWSDPGSSGSVRIGSRGKGKSAIVTWAFGGRGVGGSCPPTGYRLVLYTQKDGNWIARGEDTWRFLPQLDPTYPNDQLRHLTPGATYRVEVSTYGSVCGNLSEAAVLDFTVRPGAIFPPPSAPLRQPIQPQVRVTTGDRQVRISWETPADQFITGYQVKHREAGPSPTTWEHIPWDNIYVNTQNSKFRDTSSHILFNQKTTSYMTQHLRNDRTYQFRIRAVNGAGTGEAVEVTVRPGTHASTVIPTATLTLEPTATLILKPTATLASADPKGIAPSAPVNVQVVVDHRKKEPGQLPLVRGVHPDKGKSVVVTWTSGGDGVGGSCPPTGYRLKLLPRSLSNNPETHDRFPPQLDPTYPVYHLRHLVLDATYRVEVSAYGSACDTWSEAAVLDFTARPGAIFPPPSAPLRRPTQPQVRVTAGDGQVQISWEAPADQFITGYQVKHRKAGSSPTAWEHIPWDDIYVNAQTVKFPGTASSITLNQKMTSYMIQGLRNGQAYRFRIRAVNSAGAGKAVKVTVRPGARASTATATLEPTATATLEPTATATLEPTATATLEPTATATLEPTATATLEPTASAPLGIAPSTPTDLSVVPGATEATLTWQAGGSGVEGRCETTEYWVRVFDVVQWTVVVETSIPHPSSGVPGWVASGLIPEVEYQVNVGAYGGECGQYSLGVSTLTFTTTE